MAGLPTVQVQLDDVNNGGTWPYDISAYFRLPEGYAIARGRGDELSSVQPGTLTLTFDNTDGRFTLGSTSGGYGAINVDRGIRVRVTANAVTTTRFTGFVQSWPVSWPSGSDQFAVSQVTATDAMARWSRRTLKSVVEEEILLDNPMAYYTMGDPALTAPSIGAAMAADSSGYNNTPLSLTDGTASMANPIFGVATGPGTDGLTAVQFPTSTSKYLTTTLTQAPTWVECSVLIPAGTIAQSYTILMAFGADRVLDFTIDTSGAIGCTFANAGYPLLSRGVTHTIAVALDTAAGWFTLYVDGTVASVQAYTAGPSIYPNAMYVGQNAQLLTTVAHVAVGYGTPPSASRFVAHDAAMSSGFDRERSDLRVQRLASYEGSAMGTALDSGATGIPFIDFTGKAVAECIQQVADAEMGVAYIDGQGRTAFHNRQRSPLKVTPDLTVSVNNDIVSADVTVTADTASHQLRDWHPSQ